jgi:phosphatidyl-myo-inositol dimannoside synthase
MILFITRKHPPSIGGMQRLSRDLIRAVGGLTPARTIAWGGGNARLPLFMPYAFFKAWRLVRSRTGAENVQLIHLSDALLAPLGIALKRLTHVPVVVTVHGLDITYPNRAYQRFAPGWLRRMDRLISVSNHTLDECLARRIPAWLCEVIPNGVYSAEFAAAPSESGMAQLEQLAGEKMRGRKVLLTVGRLIERKGVANFVANTLPQIVAQRPDVCHVVIGEGPSHSLIERRITEQGMSNHVAMLGQVGEAVLKAAYHRADLFIMPNIPVPNDVEGFGLVALEAGASGTYVVANRLDGIPDAIVNGQNGTLVDDRHQFAPTVVELLSDDERLAQLGRSAHDYVAAHFDWRIIAQRYLDSFRQVITR